MPIYRWIPEHDLFEYFTINNQDNGPFASKSVDLWLFGHFASLILKIAIHSKTFLISIFLKVVMTDMKDLCYQLVNLVVVSILTMTSHNLQPPPSDQDQMLPSQSSLEPWECLNHLWDPFNHPNNQSALFQPHNSQSDQKLHWFHSDNHKIPSQIFKTHSKTPLETFKTFSDLKAPSLSERTSHSPWCLAPCHSKNPDQCQLLR